MHPQLARLVELLLHLILPALGRGQLLRYFLVALVALLLQHLHLVGPILDIRLLSFKPPASYVGPNAIFP